MFFHPAGRSRGRARLAVGATLTAVALAMTGCSSTTSGATPNTSTSSTAIPDKDGPGVSAEAITLSWGRSAFPSAEDAATIALKKEATAAVVEAFNKKGGIAGRDVKLVDPDPGTDLMAARSTALTSSGGLTVPDASNGRDACDAYTGSDVFALLFNPLVSSPYGTAAAAACLNAQGHPVIGGTAWSRSEYSAAPSSAGLAIANDRFYDALISAGKDSDFFADGAKVALITDPADTSGDVESSYEPALADAGITDPAVFPLDALATPADVLSTVVKLKAEGIDHVVFAAPNSPAMLYLLPVMQEQDYVPKMLTVDGADWFLLSVIGTVRVDEELTSAVSSYVSKPAGDIAALTDAQKQTPAGELYTEVVAANPTLQNYVSLELADSLELLKAALEASGSEYVNAEAFSAGLRALSDYSSPRLISTEFGPDRQDGGAGIVRSTFSPDCGCSTFADTIVKF